MNRYGDREYYGRIEEIVESGEESSNQGGPIRMGRVTSDLSVFDTLGESAEILIEIVE